MRICASLRFMRRRLPRKGLSRAQLFGFGLLGALEIIVRLHEKKPRARTVADLARFFQIRFCLASKRFHGAHATLFLVVWRPARLLG
jgi:hypothetical protein